MHFSLLSKEELRCKIQQECFFFFCCIASLLMSCSWRGLLLYKLLRFLACFCQTCACIQVWSSGVGREFAVTRYTVTCCSTVRLHLWVWCPSGEVIFGEVFWDMFDTCVFVVSYILSLVLRSVLVAWIGIPGVHSSVRSCSKFTSDLSNKASWVCATSVIVRGSVFYFVISWLSWPRALHLQYGILSAYLVHYCLPASRRKNCDEIRSICQACAVRIKYFQVCVQGPPVN